MRLLRNVWPAKFMVLELLPQEQQEQEGVLILAPLGGAAGAATNDGVEGADGAEGVEGAEVVAGYDDWRPLVLPILGDPDRGLQFPIVRSDLRCQQQSPGYKIQYF